MCRLNMNKSRKSFKAMTFIQKKTHRTHVDKIYEMKPSIIAHTMTLLNFDVHHNYSGSYSILCHLLHTCLSVSKQTL